MPPDADDRNIGAMNEPRRDGDTTTVTPEDPFEATALRLVLVHGETTKTMPIAKGARVVVGRSHPADVVVPSDTSLSRRHVSLVVSEDGTLTLEDLGSKNGTFVDGKKVVRAELPLGAAARLGHGTSVLVQRASGSPLLVGYDDLVRWLEAEIARARAGGGRVSLMAWRAEKGRENDVARAARTVLGPLVRAAEHHKGLVLLGLAQVSERDTARLVTKLGRDGLAGSATFPGDVTTADALVAKALGAESAGAPLTASRSPAMLALMSEARRVAASRLPVLVRGETGAGKEVVARAIHDASPRREARFLALNCGAFTKSLLEAQLFGHERGAFTGANKTAKGAFELADGGTLFLDEVGELSPEAQAALLRVLETKRLVRVGGDEEIAVDVRVVTATHRDLELMARDGTFREDLLYRLDGATLAVPPLRERPEDVEALATRFVAEACVSDGLPEKALALDTIGVLLAYPFPGNVRELKNAMMRAAVVAEGPTIEPRDLPEKMRRSSTAARPSAAESDVPDGAPGDYRDRVRAELQRIETKMITEALARAQGNQTVAARALNLPLRTLTHKIRELGIKKTFG